MTLEKTLEEFNKEWEKSQDWGGGKFGSLDEIWDGEDYGSQFEPNKDGIKNFIITLHITQWESEIKRLESMKKEPAKRLYTFPEGFKGGYNKALQDQISHYQNLISEAKKLI